MSNNDVSAVGGHLDYYIRHDISPVRYQAQDIQTHLDQRDSLYRSLGLPPVSFKNVDILEVAPGSGQNSTYLASCQPASLTLVEPNPTGRKDISDVFATLDVPHTAPEIIPKMLQDFEPNRQYDIVICENWLGALPQEVKLIKKLASLVAPGGSLVMTIVPLAGFFPNVMRKLLAMRVVPEALDFEDKTAALVDIFGPHLSTIKHMTRSHRDWVHDCMINPHYLNVGLPLSTVLDAIGNDMEVLATFPRFCTDWRWFKSLTGNNRSFNHQLAAAETANLLNFINYQKTYIPDQSNSLKPLYDAFSELHKLALSWQEEFTAGGNEGSDRTAAKISSLLKKIEASLAKFDPELTAAISDLRSVWDNPKANGDDVRDMREFASLFGRETVYLSMTRPVPR